MSTNFDVLERLYPLINVPSVNTLIDGKVYKFNKPLNSEKRDIVLSTLPLRDGEEVVVQTGTVFINIYQKTPTRPNSAFLNSVTDVIVTRLESYSQATTYMDIEIASQNVFKDQDQPNMSYSSIRLNIFIP